MVSQIIFLLCSFDLEEMTLERYEILRLQWTAANIP